jgi:RNA polymerase sigma-70 factor, ECF subfamily
MIIFNYRDDIAQYRSDNLVDDKTASRLRDAQVAEIWPRVYRYIYYKVQNREEAEELTQETFQRVHRQVNAGAVSEDKIEAYCFMTSKNLIAEVWRKRVRQPSMISMEELAGQGWEPAGPMPDTEAEDVLEINNALRQLGDVYQRVLTLRIIEGWSVKETAKMMNRSEGAIRSLQFRAVQSLKELLEKGGFFRE